MRPSCAPTVLLFGLLLQPSASYQLHARPHSLAPPAPHARAQPLAAAAAAERTSQLMGTAPPTLTLSSPAKINLFLRILRKREDGFHELSSLFQAVSLMDTLDFWQLPEDAAAPLCSMEVTPDSLAAELIPTDESNLVMRALQIFADRTGEKRRVHCRLHKRVPAQGGLGGGSADAATALHAANRLAGFPVSEAELIKWGAELGSDIGFFLSRGTAMCTGRGELIEPLPPLPGSPVYLVKPEAGLSTPAVFRALGLQPGDEFDGPDPDALLKQFQSDVASATYLNDLEPPAYQVMPRLQELRDQLKTYGFPAVMMSGSGSTIFCVGEPSAEARDTWQEAVRTEFKDVEVTVFEQQFCSRPEDEKLWYGEGGAVAAAEAPPKPSGPAPKGGPEESGPAPPEGFTWGGTF